MKRLFDIGLSGMFGGCMGVFSNFLVLGTISKFTFFIYSFASFLLIGDALIFYEILLKIFKTNTKQLLE